MDISLRVSANAEPLLAARNRATATAVPNSVIADEIARLFAADRPEVAGIDAASPGSDPRLQPSIELTID
jgi:hypothetical protein